MFRNLLRKKNFQPKLGRWGVTYEKKVLDKRINWANHDHCGSELCEKHFIKGKDSEEDEVKKWDEYLKKKKKNNNISNKGGKKKDDDEETFYYIPYCL
tara:strand:+ start:1229 stop:1522 length:294 start_codon:yes stop_codon:yes gene_type:complete